MGSLLSGSAKYASFWTGFKERATYPSRLETLRTIALRDTRTSEATALSWSGYAYDTIRANDLVEFSGGVVHEVGQPSGSERDHLQQPHLRGFTPSPFDHADRYVEMGDANAPCRQA